MNIETAIKQNKQWLKENPHLGEVKGYAALPPYKAIQLGIEALERLNLLRNRGNPYDFDDVRHEVFEDYKRLASQLLPSETGE